jgi:probable rRNA maturation factor
MIIYLENQQNKLPLNLAPIKKIVRKVLIKEGKSRSEVSIIFTNNLKIAQLNKKYLNRPRPTDVLAFPMQEGFNLRGDPHLLGDIVISVQMAISKANQLKISALKEIYLYVIHGLLHLLGYEHQKLKEDKIMRAKEKEYLKLCLPPNAG